MAGGGGIFQIDPSFFGLTGLAQGIGQATDRYNANKDRDKEQKLRDLAVLRQTVGPSSPAYIKKLQEYTGDPNVQPFMTMDEQKTAQFNTLKTKVESGTATPEETAQYNKFLGNSVLGIGSEIKSEEIKARGEEINLASGELQLKELQAAAQANQEKLAALAAQGLTPGGMAAELAILNLETARLEPGKVKADIALTNEQARTQRAQQGYLYAQTNYQNAQLAALKAQNELGLSDEDMKGYAKISSDLISAGIPLTARQVAMGFAGKLGDQQQQFTAVVNDYFGRMQQKFQVEMDKVIAEDPNSARGQAAALVKLYDKQTGTIAGQSVDPDRLVALIGTATGIPVADEKKTSMFGMRSVMKKSFDWDRMGGPPGAASSSTPMTPGQAMHSAPRFDQSAVDTQVQAIVKSAGSVAEAKKRVNAGRQLLNESTPGFGDALYNALDQLDKVTQPKAAPEPVAPTKPTNKPTRKGSTLPVPDKEAYDASVAREKKSKEYRAYLAQRERAEKDISKLRDTIKDLSPGSFYHDSRVTANPSRKARFLSERQKAEQQLKTAETRLKQLNSKYEGMFK